MTNETSAIVTTTVKDTAIENYAEREVVRELVDRMMSFHPAANEVGQQGMRMAAQMAILMNASPLPGTNEIHIWKDNKDKVKVEPGVNYWRRRSREHGDVFWIVSPRPMNGDERKYYDINNGILAAICRGVRKKEMLEMMRLGFTKQEILGGISFTGIAIVSPKEYAKNGKPLIWTALKNAEKDFYRQAFPFTPNERYATPAEGLVFDESGAVTLNSGRLDFEAEAPKKYEGLSDGQADQLNEDLFGAGGDFTGGVIVSVQQETDSELEYLLEQENADALGVDEADRHTMTPPNPETVKMWREKVEKQHRLQAGTVASMVANAVPYFDNEHHALSSTDYEKTQVFTDNATALQMFDDLVKLGTEKSA